MWRDFPVGIEAKRDQFGAKFGGHRLDLIGYALPQQKTAPYAADQNCHAVALMLYIGNRLTGRLGSTPRKSVEVAAHELRGPSIRDITCKCHGAG
jgi:hypothetical protein